jgi:ATP-binding cassette subfamily B protein
MVRRKAESGRRKSEMARLIKYLLLQYWKYKTYSTGILICIFVALAFNAFFSLSFKYFIDHIIIEKNYDKLLVLFLSLLCGFVVFLICQWLKEYWQSKMAISMQDDLRLDMFEHLQKLPVSYYDKVSKGSLLSRFTSDLGTVQSSFLSIVPAV